MKLWLDSDGKSLGGKRYFALVEEEMIDRDGNVVPLPAAIPAEPVPAPVVEAQPAPAPVVAEPVEYRDERVDELIKKVEELQAALEAERQQKAILDDEADKVEDLRRHFDERLDCLRDSLSGLAVVTRVVETIKVAEPAKEEPAPMVEEPVVEAEPETVEPEIDVVEEVAATEAVAYEPEEIVVEEVAVVPAEVTAEPEAEKKPAVRSRCFAEKMRDASEVLQDRYDELKNYALRFRKLKSRISKKFDSINQGRFQFVKLSVAGKTLKLYLNMDINTTDPKFHCKDMSDKKTYVTVPTLLRIKSGRAVKYAKRLIDQCAEQHGMLERRKPFVVDAMELIEESLQGKDMPDVEVDEVVTADEE